MMKRLRGLPSIWRSVLLGALQSAWTVIMTLLHWKIPRYDRWGLYPQALLILCSLVWWEMEGIIPTVAIGMLAFVAVFMTVRDDRVKESVAERSVWILIAFALLIVEVRVTYKDRADLDKRQADTLKEERESFGKMLEQEKSNFEQERQSFSLLRQLSDQQAQSQADLVRFKASAKQARAQSARVEQLPEVSLKKRAADLSAELFSFLAVRQANEPRLPFPATPEMGDKYFSDVTNHLDQTMALYAKDFLSKVMSVRDALSKKGIRDQTLDEWYEQPTNTHGIEIVAGRLGVLAEQLKD